MCFDLEKKPGAYGTCINTRSGDLITMNYDSKAIDTLPTSSYSVLETSNLLLVSSLGIEIYE